MTKVTGRIWLKPVWLCLAVVTAGHCWGQDVAKPSAEAQLISKPAEALYLQLRGAGLDKARVFKVREARLDRGPMHISLDDGTIAFTEDVLGRVTGAFFEGDGEVLLIPPNQVERASVAFFTGSAVLEERFLTGYFRFNDDTFHQLEPSLTPTDNADEFVSQWGEVAHNLAPTDALRLLMTFSGFLPVAGSAPAANAQQAGDRFLHARVQGRKFGPFDLFYDLEAAEQLWVGQPRTLEGSAFYDLWTAFSTDQKKDASTGVDSENTSSAISVSQYKIQTTVKLPTEISAEAWLQMDVNRGGQRTVFFELSRFLQIKSVEANGQPIEFIHNQAVEGTQLARRGNDLVALVFPQPLHTGRIELHFVYGGEVLSDAGGGLFYVGARGTWFPNRRLAMSKFDLEFRYPAGWTLVATGKKVEEAAASPGAVAGEQVSRWVSERPIPLAGFNLGKYERASAKAGTVVVESYASLRVENSFPKATPQVDDPGPLIPSGLRPSRIPTVVSTPPPPSPARHAQAVAETSARAVDFFARRFGPFPYSQLALTQKPGALNQGWPGLVFLSSFSFLSEGEKSQLVVDPVTRLMSNSVIAHETAHQWWGDLVTWDGYRDQWIVEGLADYSAMMLLETTDPRRFREVMDKYRDDLMRKNKAGQQLMEAGPVTLGTRLYSSHFPEGYEVISYGRGTWLFHMLRCMMRDGAAKGPGAQGPDEPFIRALRKVRERYQGKAITTLDLVHVFEEELPPSLWHEGRKSLDWFYEGWINGTAVPRFELSRLKYLNKDGATMVAGTIIQKDAPQELVTPVPVCALIGSRTVLLGRVFVEEGSTSFQLSAPAGTRKVVLDPNQTLLTRSR